MNESSSPDVLASAFADPGIREPQKGAVVGIIAEYNPFHPGHRYHIEQTRKLLQPSVLVVIVSGFYSSRGLPSLLTPEKKAALALEAGADLVIELPAVYAVQSADHFARYAMESLKTAGVEVVCFGSEMNDLARLQAIAKKIDCLERDPATSLARSAARQIEALHPNDLLAIQYLRQAARLDMDCVCIARNPRFRSATQSRKDYFAGIHHEEDHLYEPRQRWQSYYPYLRMQLLMSSPEYLASFFLVSEGIESRLIKAAARCETWQDFLQSTISKTYSKARIQRTCLQILLQTSKEEMDKHNHYCFCKVLGFNAAGQKWLKTLQSLTEAEGRICSRIKDLPAFLRHEDLQARTLYSLINQSSLIPWKAVKSNAVHSNESIQKLQKETETCFS